MVLKQIEERASCSEYLAQEIETEKLERILNAGNAAPSTFNNQPWDFILVTDREKLEKMQDLMREVIEKDMKEPMIKELFEKEIEIFKKYHMLKLEPEVSDFQCPAVIAIVENSNRNHSQLPSPLNEWKIEEICTYLSIGAAMQNILLQVQTEGLAARPNSMLCTIKEKELRELFNIPEEHRLLLLIAVGYPAVKESREHPEKMDLERVLHLNTYGG